jgi:hypothetical protein
VPDRPLQAVFDRGHRVGELARERFPGGVLVDADPSHVAVQTEASRTALASGAPAVFEASVAAGGALADIDVLERLPSGWALVEVKSTLEVKPRFLPDVAFQLHVARAAGLDVRRAEVMHLNRDCAYPRLEDLFVREDVTAEAEALLPGIPGQLEAMRVALAGPLPEVAPGPQCHSPYECPFLDRCNPPLAADDVAHLYYARPSIVAAWRAAGITRLGDIPDDMPLAPAQRRQIRAARAGARIVDPGLAGALDAIALPAAFLDFETVSPPVPVWSGCHPYEPVPVQVSCHLVLPDGSAVHHAHLAEGPGDPRPALAEAVLAACARARSVVAYNASFEARCLDHLARAVPAPQLQAVRDRLVDLLPIVRDHVYDPAFGGGFGLKAVLPALVPGLGYGDLAVADGNTAAALLEGLLLASDGVDPTTRETLRAQLLAYCERDTEALVALHGRLRELARGDDAPLTAPDRSTR